MIKWLKRLRETYYGSINEQPTKYGFNVGDTLYVRLINELSQQKAEIEALKREIQRLKNNS